MTTARAKSAATGKSISEVVRKALEEWTHGGYWMAFVTDDHRHGNWHKTTGEVEWDERVFHYSSCQEMFGDREEWVK